MPNPIIFRIGPIIITYYVLVYALAFLTILYLLLKNSEELNLTKSQCYDLLLISLISVLIGARLFHVLFWGLNYYLKNPIKILCIWQGGMSFHGGLLGAAIALLIFSKIKKINLLKIADIITLPLIIFLALARLANFINQEILGTITSSFPCINFKTAEGCRHPVQLYASAGRAIQFLILLTIKKLKSFKPGFIFWSFLLTSGIGRFFLDFIRQDAIYSGLKAGQWFSIILIIISIYALNKNHRQDLKSLISQETPKTPEH